jgi:predicted dehydrogenase
VTTINIGILGCGNISQTHARAALEIDNVRVSAVCGQNPEKVARLAGITGATAYHHLEQFLSHKPMDLVLIGSPSSLHADQGIAAARHRLHVLVEKPIDISVDRADALIAACEQAGVKLGVFFQDRAAPDIVALKKVIDDGRLGKPILVSASVRWHRPPEYYSESRWRGTWALDGGGALMNQGIHTVDLLLWLFGDVRRTWARAVTSLHDIDVEDTVVASLEFENGAIGCLEAATSAFPGMPRRIAMTWSQGTIVVENDRIRSANLRAEIEQLTRLTAEARPGEYERSTSAVVSDVAGHRALIEDFIRAIETDGTPMCDGPQARRSVQLVRAIYESSRTGLPMSPSGHS